jgi:checkpoint serine/threonine-protein kinase
MKNSDTLPALQAPVVNSKTGRPERVFVNLEAVYPNSANPSEEMSFDELRAMHRGWANKDWRKESMRTLQGISGNAQRSPPSLSNAAIDKLSRDLEKKAVIDENIISQQSTPTGDSQSQSQEIKPSKQKRMKIREIKQETQTSKPHQISYIFN